LVAIEDSESLLSASNLVNDSGCLEGNGVLKEMSF
jgi:hypothetical protein